MEQASLNRLMELLKVTGGKFVIVEQGQPMAVLLGFDEFESLAMAQDMDGLAVNQEITNAMLDDELKQQVILPEESDDDIRIEPLNSTLT